MMYNLVAFVLAWFSLAGFLLTTFIVNDVAGNPPDSAPVEGFPFGRATPVVNAVLQVIYLTVLVMQFVIALGGRAKSYVTAYITSFVVFAIVQLYLFMNLIYLTKRLIDYKRDTNGGSSFSYIGEYYENVGSLTVLVTAISFFGVYIAAGIVCLDPWHLLLTWAQYLFVSTSYVNILKTYAFSNVHDVTWGQKTGKRDVKAPIQGPVKTVSHGVIVEVEIIRPTEDLDVQFEQSVRRALEPHKRETISEPVTLKERFEKFRTTMVGIYISPTSCSVSSS